MAKEKNKENKVTLEREYVIPIKRKLRHTPDYKKARKAVKVVLEFVAKHMRVEDRDVRKVKMNKLVNHELWFRGIANPPNKIKVKVKKMSDGTVHVELFEIPKILQHKVDREKKHHAIAEKEAKTEAKEAKKEEHDHAGHDHEGHDHSQSDQEHSDEKKDDAKEKQASTVEAGIMKAAKEAKQQKHITSTKPSSRQTPVQRNIPKSN